MLNLDLSGNTANDAWISLIRRIYESGEESKPRNLRIREILCRTTVINMARSVTTSRPHLGYRFLAAEAWWILSGKNDVTSIAPYSPHIASFSDDGFFFEGAYGPRVVTQLRYVADKVIGDRDTRQAVIGIWRDNPRETKDGSCTLSIQWMVRNNKLHCIDTMRSSDAWLGWPYDIFNFSMLSTYLLLILRARGFSKDVGLGNLYLTAGSQHLYVNPRADGAKNIPYTLEDVREILSVDDAQKDRHHTCAAPCNCFSNPAKYAPLDVDEFASPGDFLNHLELIKDRKDSGHRWIRELLLKD